MWAHSDMPVDRHPDIITMAKPLANGFPIGAVLMRETIAESMSPGKDIHLQKVGHRLTHSYRLARNHLWWLTSCLCAWASRPISTL